MHFRRVLVPQGASLDVRRPEQRWLPGDISWGASRGGLESARAVLIVALGLGVASASVGLAERHATRWDLTPEQRHSVSPRTAEVLTQLAGPPIEVLGFFVAIGHEPTTKLFRGNLAMDEQGYLKVGPGSRTDIEGVFVAGDVHDHTYRQAVTAAGAALLDE